MEKMWPNAGVVNCVGGAWAWHVGVVRGCGMGVACGCGAWVLYGCGCCVWHVGVVVVVCIRCCADTMTHSQSQSVEPLLSGRHRSSGWGTPAQTPDPCHVMSGDVM